MANELAFALSPNHAVGGGGANPYGSMTDPRGMVPIGVGAGLGFVDNITGSAYIARRIPNAVLLGTGLTVDLLLAEDPSVGNVDAVNKNIVLGITVGAIASGASTFDENASTGPLAGSTEVFTTVTMPATAGLLKIVPVAIPIASMNGLAAGGWAMVRIRRLGANGSDSSRGRHVLLGADVRNT